MGPISRYFSFLNRAGIFCCVTNKDELCRFVFDDGRNTGAMRRPLSATVIGIYSGTIPNKFIVLSPPGCN